MNISGDTKSRAKSFLARLPRSEEEWYHESRESALGRKTRFIVNTPSIVNYEQIFKGYADRIGEFADSLETADVEYLKIIALGTAGVILSDTLISAQNWQSMRDEIYNGIRICFRKSGSDAELNNNIIGGHIKAISLGAKFIYLLQGHYGQRAHELYQYARLLSTFLILKQTGVTEYLIEQIKSSGFRPKKQWDSTPISIPELIQKNLQGFRRLYYIYEWCNVPYSLNIPDIEHTVLGRSEGEVAMDKLSEASRQTQHTFLDLGYIQELDEAISEILVCRTVTSYQPSTEAGDVGNVVHDYGLPEACTVYLESCQKKLAPQLQSLFTNQRIDIESTSPIHQAIIQLDAGVVLDVTPKDIFVPLFHNDLDVFFEVGRAHGHPGSQLYLHNWKRTTALWLSGKGIMIKQGSIRMGYLQYN